MLCGELNGKEIEKRGDICIYIADSLCCTVETNTNCKATILQKKWILKNSEALTLGKCKVRVQWASDHTAFSSTDQYITSFYVFLFNFWFNIYIINSLTLKSEPTGLQLIPEWSLCITCLFSVRHITAFLHLGTLDSTSALVLGTILNNKIINK